MSEKKKGFVYYADLRREGETMIEVPKDFAWAYDRLPQRYVREENIVFTEEKKTPKEPVKKEVETTKEVEVKEPNIDVVDKKEVKEVPKVEKPVVEKATKPKKSTRKKK